MRNPCRFIPVNGVGMARKHGLARFVLSCWPRHRILEALTCRGYIPPRALSSRIGFGAPRSPCSDDPLAVNAYVGRKRQARSRHDLVFFAAFSSFPLNLDVKRQYKYDTERLQDWHVSFVQRFFILKASTLCVKSPPNRHGIVGIGSPWFMVSFNRSCSGSSQLNMMKKGSKYHALNISDDGEG